MATYDDANNTVSARSYLSFQLNFFALMMNAGRDEEAHRSLSRLIAGIEQLPEEVHINVTDEMTAGH